MEIGMIIIIGAIFVSLPLISISGSLIKIVDLLKEKKDETEEN